MKEVYENILLDPSHWDEKTKSFKLNFDDIDKGFNKLGYREYKFEAFSIYSLRNLTEEEIENYKQESDEIIGEGVEEITKEINKRILEDILKRKKLA